MTDRDTQLQELQTLRTEAFDQMIVAFDAYMAQVEVVKAVLNTEGFEAEMQKLRDLHAEYAAVSNEHDRLVERIYKFYI